MLLTNLHDFLHNRLEVSTTSRNTWEVHNLVAERISHQVVWIRGVVEHDNLVVESTRVKLSEEECQRVGDVTASDVLETVDT